MRRRALLAGLAGLAGCSGLSSDETPDSTLTPAPIPTATPAPTPDRFEPIGDLADAVITRSAVGGRTVALYPGRYRFEDLEALVRGIAPATTDHPARFRAQLRGEPNTTVPAVLPPFVPRLQFVATDADDGSSGERPRALYLVPAPGTEGATHTPGVELAHGGGTGGGVWRLESDPATWLPERIRIPADGRVTATFRLVADPDATAPPTGRYRKPPGGRFRPRITVWDTDAPGPTAESRFDRRVPSLPGTRPTRWYHELTARAAVYLRPSTERLGLPGTVAVELVNHSRRVVNAGGWSLHRLVDGDWYELGPLFRTAILRMLPPGGRHRWRFGLTHGAPDETVDAEGPDDRIGFLGGGLYAIAAGSTADEARPAALVELMAPSLSVRPTPDARTVRDGDPVVVRGDPEPDPYGDDESAVLVLDRLPADDRATPRPGTATSTDPGIETGDPGDNLSRLIAEQVMRSRGLRNTLGFADGAERIRFRTSDSVARNALRRVDARAEGRRFRFGGGRFRLDIRYPDPGDPDGDTATPYGTPTGRPK